MSFIAGPGCNCHGCQVAQYGTSNKPDLPNHQAVAAPIYNPPRYNGPTCSECDEEQAQYYYLCDVNQKCSSCCTCESRIFCQNCGDQTSDYCGSCENGDCCCCCPKSDLTPGWVRRGEHVEGDREVNPDTKPQTSTLDPIQGMADFYLTDYVMFVTSTAPKLPEWGSGLTDYMVRNTKGRWHLPNPWAAEKLHEQAKKQQQKLVDTLDVAFRNYVFMALGGEVRHHPSIKSCNALNVNSRSSAWNQWLILGEVIGRASLLEDAVELFEDDDGWRDGFGGEAWALPAKLMLARERGEIDARTWVDRVFTLQHNGGSLLDKKGWASCNRLNWNVGFAKHVGDAHASNPTNFSTLLQLASAKTLTLYRKVLKEPWVFRSKGAHPQDAESIRQGIKWVACKHDMGGWNAKMGYHAPWHECWKCGFSTLGLETS